MAPLVGDLTARCMDTLRISQNRRAEILFRHIVEGDDNSEELVERIDQALLKGGSETAAALQQALRSALGAVDLAVVPSLAMLFRLSFGANLKPLPLWRTRRYMQALEGLTATEFGDLRTFVHGVLATPGYVAEFAVAGEGGKRDSLPVCAAVRADGTRTISTAWAGGSEQELLRIALHDSHRVLQVLVENRLARELDGDDGIMADFPMLRVLADVMPLPAD